MNFWSSVSWGTGVVVLTGACVYVAGLALPEEHVAERSREVRATVAHVTERVLRVQEQPQWRRDVTRIDVLVNEPGRTRYIEYSGGDAIAYEVQDLEGEWRVESRIVSRDLPFGGRWLIALEPIGDHGTVVTIREEGVVYSPMFRALSHYIFGHTRTMETYLDDLEHSFVEKVGGT